MTFRKSDLTPCTLALFASICLVAGNAGADNLTFEATTAFPLTDAGEVPYYSEAPGRDSLAINAAIEDYRDKFARATMVFEGPSGYFDITLTTLAELDGEAPYRVLINDVLVGSATNPEVTVDYTPIEHTFENIVVPEGAVIAVESLANTNGKIPEGDGTAFARGRWTTLEFNNDDAGTTSEDTVDLSVSARLDTRPAMVGESRVLTLTVENATDSAVATQPVLTLTRVSSEVGVDTTSLENCTESGNDVICTLSEIPAGGSAQVAMTLIALQPSPATTLQITVSADQTDSDTENNSITLPLQIDVDQTITEESEESEEQPVPVTDNENNSGTDPNQLEATAGDATSSSRSSGGASNALWLLLLAAVCLRRRFGR